MATAVSGVTMGSVVAEILRRYPRREAFVAGDRRLTYADASTIVGRLMSGFAARGIGLGSGVALLSPNRPESWLAAVASYMLGATKQHSIMRRFARTGRPVRDGPERWQNIAPVRRCGGVAHL